MKGLALADYIVITAFFAVMIGVGVYYSRKSKSSDQFFGNDKSVPWWLSGVSFYMNSFSALAFVMYSALAYKFGWVPVTVSWLSVPAVLLGAWFLAVRWRRAAKGSPIDYIAERYTPGMCKTLAILGLPMQLLDNALKLLAIGTVVGVGMGFPLFWSICISGVIIVLYTFLGGLKATLTCDFIQFLVILAVVFTLPFACLERLAECGGHGVTALPVDAVVEAGRAVAPRPPLVEGFRVFLDKVPAGFFDFTAGKYTWVYMLVFFCCVGSTLSTNWSLVQRYYSTKSEKDAKKMAYLVAALLFVGPPVFFFPAMAARVFLPGIPETEMNGVYAILCREVLPVGMIGMVIAAMFSATMSSLAGNFNAAAAVVTDALKLKGLVAARIATVVIGGLVVALTFVMQYAQGADDLFNLSNKVFGVFLPPIAIPMLCGVFVRRFSKRAGMFGLVGGISVGLAVFVVGGWHPFLREMIWIFPMTVVATVLFLFLGTLCFRDSPEERAAVERFMDRVAGRDDIRRDGRASLRRDEGLSGRPVRTTSLALGLALCGASLFGGTGRVLDIRDFGARESDLLQTKAIQAAIDAAAGGGEVTIPAGRFRTGGLVLKSGVTLRLADGAELVGDVNPDNYPGSNRWYRALIRADGARDVAIVGGRHSTIDGRNVYDPRGEENYRGPHAIMFIGCTNVTLRGYTVRDSANWAHAIFHCGNVRIADVRVFGGHDAVDFHDSTDVTVENCELRTGDDCIAGYANYRCRVRDCVLDTSCQAFRLGGADILVERCQAVHPSSFGHRYGLPIELKRAGATVGEGCHHGMGVGVIYYCDARWRIDRPQRDIVFRDCVFDRPRKIFALNYNGRDMWCCRHPLESISFERCVFKGVEHPISIYGDAEKPLDFTMRDCTVSAAPDAAERELLTAYNFGRITLENVTLEGFRKPHLVTRAKGEVIVKGGTPVANVFRPDPKDKTLTFAECAEALAKLPGDDAAWEKWAAAHPTPPESRWSEEKGLYVTDDPHVVDVWGSALAVLRGETSHAAAIARRLCGGYQYYVGWGRTGAVKPNLDGELSPLPAGPFGYAMAQFDPLFARTFFTDFIRREPKTPAAVAGVRRALSLLVQPQEVPIR